MKGQNKEQGWLDKLRMNAILVPKSWGKKKKTKTILHTLVHECHFFQSFINVFNDNNYVRLNVTMSMVIVRYRTELSSEGFVAYDIVRCANKKEWYDSFK